MPKFLYTTVGGGEVGRATHETVAAILNNMQDRPTWEGVCIAPDEVPGPDGAGQFPILSLSWYPEYGYEVQCYESAARSSDFLATDVALSAPEYYVELGGQGQELWPRQLFVSASLATQSARYFIEHGHEDPSLVWVPINRFPRRAVKRQRR